jgi:prenyltransferase beta subunit
MMKPAFLISLILFLPSAETPTPAEKKATVAFLQHLQTPGGGFLPGPENPKIKRPTMPSLRATTAGLRALKYFGGEPRDRDACRRFVESCFNKELGGFADQRTAKPDFISTAVGIMAVVELKMPTEPYADAVVKYLGENAKTFEEIRLAAAGLESLGKRPPQADAWLKQIGHMQNPDGSFGKGNSAARDTGSAVAAILRLGGKVKDRERVIQVIKEGQRADGAFGKGEVQTSDLETSYRVIRCLHMLKEKPADVEACPRFITKCRNSDGGYGVAPGQVSSTAGTYFAGIILHWLEEK